MEKEEGVKDWKPQQPISSANTRSPINKAHAPKSIPRLVAATGMSADDSYHTPISVPELVSSGKFLHIAAPMVRLPFRLLCRKYGCDLAYTPMITSEDFVASEEARLNEFSTNFGRKLTSSLELQNIAHDQPLVVQFAAKSAETLSRAAEYVVGHCSGIDINCGCPQKWAMKEGYGGALLTKPDLIKDMPDHPRLVFASHCIVQNLTNSNTVELCKRAEKVGVEWITVHGRTVHQASTESVNYDAVKLVKENMTVPVFGNGNCFDQKDVQDWKTRTGIDGVMAARGLLANPALFMGYERTPLECVRDFVQLSLTVGGTTTRCFHQHIAMMLYNTLSRGEKMEYQSLKSITGILDWLSVRGITSSQ